MNGNNLKTSIKKKGITQEKAADILGVSRQSLNSWCKQISLSEEVIKNVKTLLGIDLEADEVDMPKGSAPSTDIRAETPEVAEPIAVVGSGNAFSGMTDQEVEDFLATEFNKRLLEMYEAGRAAPAVEMRRHQQRIEELSAQVAKLEYINQELTLKLTTGKSERRGEAEHEKRAPK